MKSNNRSLATGLASTAVLATLLSLGAGVAQAQEGFTPAPTVSNASSGPKKMSLSLNVPGGGNPAGAGTAGLWMMMNPQLNVGFNVGLALDNENDPGHDILLAPALRYYFASMGPVAPFYYGTARIRIVDQDDDNVQVGLAGGLGAEWFVTDVFSIAGWTGLGIDLVRAGEGIGIGTLTSGISAQIYWD